MDRAAGARNTRYLRHAHAYQLVTGDSANTLREKRRWLRTEYQARRILGKSFRELRDFFSKHKISKPKNRRSKVHGLTDAAKIVKQQLEEVFRQNSCARPAVGAMSQALSEVPGDTGEMPNATILILDGTHTDKH